jgi:hypothetical protein
VKLETRKVFGWGASGAGSASPKNGLVIHYDGSDQDLADGPHSECQKYWRETRVFHMGPQRGWADIGYSFAACPHGVILEGRGLGKVQAAQPGGNSTWYSCTLMSGPSETPNTAQINAVRELRAWLRGKGVGAAVRGHRDFIDTSCPGPIAYRMVQDGTFTGTPTEEDDMPLSDADLAKIRDIVWNTDTAPAPTGSATKTNPTWRHINVMRDTYTGVQQIKAAVLELVQRDPDVDEAAIVAGVLAGLPPEAIAAALVDALPEDLAAQVLDELGARLAKPGITQG